MKKILIAFCLTLSLSACNPDEPSQAYVDRTPASLRPDVIAKRNALRAEQQRINDMAREGALACKAGDRAGANQIWASMHSQISGAVGDPPTCWW